MISYPNKSLIRVLLNATALFLEFMGPLLGTSLRLNTGLGPSVWTIPRLERNPCVFTWVEFWILVRPAKAGKLARTANTDRIDLKRGLIRVDHGIFSEAPKVDKRRMSWDRKPQFLSCIRNFCGAQPAPDLA